jgi:L-fucose dehydrogenase
MDLGLKDKVILVTGGARGIGAAIVRAAAREGAVPVIIDREAAPGEEVQLQVRNSGATCELIATELSSPENCKKAVEASAQKCGRIDALVNNAGINDKVGLESGSPSEFVASLERNLMHYYNMAHFGLPHLKRSKGTIVNVGSKTAVTGQGGTSGYACAKGGIMALTREWAVELLPYSIRVNAVLPAEVMTPLYRQWLNTFPNPDEKLRLILSRIPFENRMTTPGEIAATVMFLLSPQSAHTTGQHLFVDGGYVHLDRAAT